MGRAAVGCTLSTSRESTIAIIGELFGLDSEEEIGVMGGYVTGTVLGTVFFGLMASICAHTGFFHPYALGEACGVGSASMMSASLGALEVEFPQMAEQIQTYAYTSQALTNGDGMLMSLILTLPMTNWLYKKCAHIRGIDTEVTPTAKDWLPQARLTIRREGRKNDETRYASQRMVRHGSPGSHLQLYLYPAHEQSG